MMLEVAVLATVVAWNIIAFALYGIDKSKAKKGKWRISEATLITIAFIMGGVGSVLGMRIFRHKTQHMKFRLLVPLAVVINIGIVTFIICGKPWF